MEPSAGKHYPFLKQLSESGFLEETPDKDTSRNKTLYRLTFNGIKLVNNILLRMRNLIDARTSLQLDVCTLYGVTEVQVVELDDEGIERKYCCVHCRDAKDDGNIYK